MEIDLKNSKYASASGDCTPDPHVWDLLFQYRNPLLKILAIPLSLITAKIDMYSGEDVI